MLTQFKPNSYRAAFFALPPEKQAPHPFAVLQGLSLANKAAEIQSRFPSTGPLSNEPAPPCAARTVNAVNPAQDFPHLNPECQPMRQEMQNIIDLYLQPHSLSPVTSLVSANTLRQALSDAKVTTHPSALDPVASNIHSHITTEVLPRFLNHAVSNLSAATSRGRMLIACIACMAAIVLEVFLIMYRTNRAARLLALPLWILAIGYAIGSQTGICFWLAWRGTREHKSYEGTGHLSSSSPKESSFKTSAANIHSALQRPRALLARFRFFTRERQESVPDRPDTMAEKGQLPVDINLGATVDEKRVSLELRKSLSGDYSVKSRDSFAPLVEPKDGLVKKIMRLTGTAVDTIAVEDSRVR